LIRGCRVGKTDESGKGLYGRAGGLPRLVERTPEVPRADWVRCFLKAELKRADVSYKELAERLTRCGLEETEIGIASKLARGTFSAYVPSGMSGCWSWKGCG
jgi:hypothetical protein